jgi:hypothetical protein
MKKLLVALVLITGLSVLTFGASEINWLSTQFNPGSTITLSVSL